MIDSYLSHFLDVCITCKRAQNHVVHGRGNNACKKEYVPSRQVEFVNVYIRSLISKEIIYWSEPAILLSNLPHDSKFKKQSY